MPDHVAAIEIGPRPRAAQIIDKRNYLLRLRNKIVADCLDADAFELNSTIRQLTEVWQLNDQEPPGNHLLPILKAAAEKEK